MYKEMLQFNHKKQITQLKKWVKDLNRYLSKSETQMTNKHRKRYSTLLAVREMSWTGHNKKDNSKFWGWYGEMETLTCCWWGFLAALGNSLAVSQR